MGTVHLWVMKKQRATDLLENGCDIGIRLSVLSFLFPLTLSCSLAFLVLFPWSASVTLILSYPSTSRALKLTRIFLSDMSDSTSEIPENVQVFYFFLHTNGNVFVRGHYGKYTSPDWENLPHLYQNLPWEIEPGFSGTVSNREATSLCKGEYLDGLEITVKGRQFNANHTCWLD